MKSINWKMVCAAGLGSLFLVPGAGAALTWQVQADFSSAGLTRSVRGIALSPDESQEYLGFIQGTTAGTTAISEYSTGILSGTNPASTATANTSGRQAKGVAVDDRGNVYLTYNSSTSSTTQQFRIYNSALTSVTATQNISLTASSQLGGIAVQDFSGTYYAYVTSNKGTAVIQRWDVTNPAAPVLDSTFGVGGTMNLKTITGGGSNAFVNGLDIAPDGTIYATGGLLSSSTDRGDEVFKINSTGTSILAETPVTEAIDAALYGGNLYVAEYNGGSSAIGVLNASDLSSVTTLTTPFVDTNPTTHALIPAGSDDGYAGITVNSVGQLFVTDEVYNGDTTNSTDRVLVSSAVPEPTSLCVLGLGTASMLTRRSRRRL